MRPTSRDSLFRTNEYVIRKAASVRPAGSLADDARAFAEDAARAAADEITPTVNAAMRDPQFARNMGAGVVQELQKPASAPVLQQIGSAAGNQVANVPLLVGAALVGGLVAGFIAGTWFAK